MHASSWCCFNACPRYRGNATSSVNWIVGTSKSSQANSTSRNSASAACFGAVASQPDRGTAYSEPWIEDSFQQTWPHARRDPETLLDGEDPVIRRYPREDVDGTEYRYRAATPPPAGVFPGAAHVALPGAQPYQDATQQEEANLLLAAEYERQRDNRRCCARKRQYNTYAYPDAFACLEATGCRNTKVYEELKDECEMACKSPKDQKTNKAFRNPTLASQPGRTQDEIDREVGMEYDSCGGALSVWTKACQPPEEKGAGAGLAPGLAAGLAAAVASVSAVSYTHLRAHET